MLRINCNGTGWLFFFSLLFVVSKSTIWVKVIFVLNIFVRYNAYGTYVCFPNLIANVHQLILAVWLVGFHFHLSFISSPALSTCFFFLSLPCFRWFKHKPIAWLQMWHINRDQIQTRMLSNKLHFEINKDHFSSIALKKQPAIVRVNKQSFILHTILL